MDALPAEILIDIFSRLPVNSVCCVRCVSKAMLKTVDDLSFATLHMQRRVLDDVQQVPRLVLRFPSTCGERMHPLKYDGNDLLTKSKHAIVSEFESTTQHPYEHDFVFCNLFGFTSGRSCLLVNPFKGEFLMLPTRSDLQVLANSFCNHHTYGMGFDNMTNTYKIVRISNHEYSPPFQREHRMVAEVLVLGTSSWRELPLVPPCDPFYKVAASTHGEVHWLVENDDHKSFVRILSFDFKKEEFHWTPHPLEKKRGLMHFVHLLNFMGSLALVDASSSNIQIWVLVLKNYKDKKKQEWVLNYEIDIQHHLPLARHMPMTLTT